jgi:membrane complex biogenesis BtpA family protein
VSPVNAPNPPEICLSAISRQKPNAVRTIFGAQRVVIGVLHCPPLPGAPRHNGESFKQTLDIALAEATAYAKGGVDGLIIENHGDIPFLKPDEIGPEISAGLAVIADRVAQTVNLPLGINVLANGAISALAVAKASGARFVRVNQWANAYVANEGLVEGEAARALRYRKAIGATDVAIFADAHVKHGAHAIVADRPVSELVRDVEFFDADAVIATGQRTGDAATTEEIGTVRSGTSLPVLVGSGVSVENVGVLLPLVDGVIVASSLKEGGVWWNRVDEARLTAFMQKVQAIRECLGEEGASR